MVTTRSGKKTTYQPTKYQLRKAMSTVPMRSVSLASAVSRIVRRTQETKVFNNTTSSIGVRNGTSVSWKVYFDPFSGIQLGSSQGQRIGDEIYVTKVVICLSYVSGAEVFSDAKFKGRLVSAANFTSYDNPDLAAYAGQSACWTKGTPGTNQAWLEQIDGVENHEVMKFHGSKGHTVRAHNYAPATPFASYGFGSSLATWRHQINLNRKVKFEKGSTTAKDPATTSFIYLIYGLIPKEVTAAATKDDVLSVSYAVFYKDA